MKKIIYILSLSHSGSTLLDILLGSRSDAISLGEIFAVLESKKKTYEGTEHVCSCGTEMRKCQVWGSYSPLGYKLDAQEYAQEYENMLNLPVVSEKSIIVDSSKRISSLKKIESLNANGTIKIHAVLLLRDPRGWVLSHKDALRKSGQHQRSVLRLLLRWWKMNWMMKKHLEERNIPYTVVAYESLCFDQERALEHILEDVGVHFTHVDGGAVSHVAYGNRMKEGFLEKGVVYDGRWKKHPYIRILGALFLVFMPSYRKLFKH